MVERQCKRLSLSGVVLSLGQPANQSSGISLLLPLFSSYELRVEYQKFPMS